MSDADDVLFQTAGRLGRITLNRPKALNALSLDQIRAIHPMLDRWAADDAIAAVVIDGAGPKAFCAGGDIRAIYDAGRAGDHAGQAAFFREEYRLNRRIKTYPKPYVALIDGITMGGGVGLSVHGRFRVATEHTLFAMPETGIGFYPDVGGTFFLPRCPGRVGLYLALTGARLKAADTLYAGIATHYVPAARLDDLVGALSDAGTPAAVQAVLDAAHQDPGPALLAERRALIDRCFAADSVPAILDALAADDDPWASATRDTLVTKSPTALLVTFRQMLEGAALDFDSAMRLEYRLSQHFFAGHDFYEGVRSVIVDKDNKPVWHPAALADVSAATVAAHFAPAPAGELDFD